MVRARQDKYTLGECSVDKNLPSGGQSIRLDVVLEEKKDAAIGASIEGFVYDDSTLKLPVQGALVKITDEAFNDVSYTLTDVNGKYLFNLPLENGRYNIFVAAKYKKLSSQVAIDVIKGENKLLPGITLQVDPSSQLGIIAGELTDVNKSPIFGGAISLYKVDVNPPVLIGVTYSNEYGIYAFREVQNGTYSIKYSSLGYLSKSSENINVIGNESIVSSNAALSVDSNASNGTISGMVMEANTNIPINRGDVILYRIETDESLTPIAYTKTSSQGVYLFINVAPGRYKVLSNEIQVVETGTIADGPNIDKITIARRGIIDNTTVSFLTGELSGGAYIDPTMNWVLKGIGENNGKSTLKVDSINEGSYKIYVLYISQDMPRFLSMYIDGQLFSTTKTPNYSTGNSYTSFYMLTGLANLSSGNHTFTVAGDGVNQAPWVRDLIIVESRNSYPLDNGQLQGGAAIDATTGYITGIGGVADGSRNFTVNVDKLKNTGKYSMTIKYLAGSGDMPLRVTVNGVDIDSIAKKTANNLASSALTQTIVVSLNMGANTIKIHGNGTAAGPMTGAVALTYANNETIIEAESTLLSGSASISNGFVQNIGGQGDGAITLNYNTPYDGYYDVIVKYVAPDATRKIEVIANGTNSGPISLAKTSTMLAANAVDKTVPVYLNAGNNTIVIRR